MDNFILLCNTKFNTIKSAEDLDLIPKDVVVFALYKAAWDRSMSELNVRYIPFAWCVASDASHIFHIANKMEDYDQSRHIVVIRPCIVLKDKSDTLIKTGEERWLYYTITTDKKIYINLHKPA